MSSPRYPLIARYLKTCREAMEIIGEIAHRGQEELSPTAKATLEELQEPLTSKAGIAAVAASEILRMQAARAAQKYLLSESALTLIEQVRPKASVEGATFPSPDTHVWLELERTLPWHPTIAGVFLVNYHKKFELLSAKAPALYAKARAASQWDWNIELITGQGSDTETMTLNATTLRWTLGPNHTCPSGECQKRVAGEQWEYTTCLRCAARCLTWLDWVHTALLVIAGVYREAEEVRPTLSLEAIHMEKAGREGKKRKPVVSRFDYEYVTFDATKKGPSPAKPSGGEGHSWLEELDPASVVYVKHAILGTQRHLDPERNPRWKSKRVVSVKEHERAVPMKLDKLRKRLTRVVATKYKGKEGNMGHA